MGIRVSAALSAATTAGFLPLTLSCPLPKVSPASFLLPGGACQETCPPETSFPLLGDTQECRLLPKAQISGTPEPGEGALPTGHCPLSAGTGFIVTWASSSLSCTLSLHPTSKPHHTLPPGVNAHPLSFWPAVPAPPLPLCIRELLSPMTWLVGVHLSVLVCLLCNSGCHLLVQGSTPLNQGPRHCPFSVHSCDLALTVTDR